MRTSRVTRKKDPSACASPPLHPSEHDRRVASLSDAFLNQFEPHVRSQLIEFGKRLNTSEADVVMTMARKATCLLNALDSLGLTTINATNTSDRVKDMDLSWVKGKNVLLVDDVVVFGSTLAAARDSLLKAGAKKVDVTVLCVSEDRWDRSKIEPKPPFLVLPHSQVVSVCATIVDAISVLPMPYAVDYPVFSRLRVPKESFQSYFGLPPWEARDVSSPWQRESGIFSITCKPPPEVITELENRVGWNCAPISLAKIRLYIRSHTNDKGYWQCSALPIVILQAMTERALEGIWDLLKRNSSSSLNPVWSNFASATSKLRLIQYLLASTLAGIWLEGVARHVLKRPALGQDRRILESVFSPPSLALVQLLVEHKGRLFNGAPRVEPLSDPPDLELPTAEAHSDANLASIRARLADPFISLEETSEREAQLKGRVIPAEKWNKVRVNSPFNRLERGFTHRQLQEHMSHLGSDASEAVSLFLDQAIDRGIAVPITTARNGLVFRAYRHGEDVLFSKSEIRLFGIAIEACAAASNRLVLPHLLVEKLLVLVLRIGLQQKFLHPFLGVPGSPGTVGIRFSLHGAVAQSEVSEMYGHNEERWLSRLLQEFGVIEELPLEDAPGTGFKVKSLIDASVYAGAENKTKMVGTLVGHLHRPGTEKNKGATVSLDEWTLIATCATEPDVVGALSAEIDIFCRSWWTLKSSTLQDASSRPGLASRPTTSVRQSRSYIAVNSGKWKFERYRAGLPQRLIYADIPARIPDPVYQSVWISFWPEHGDVADEGRDPEVSELLLQQAIWFYEANIYYRLFALAIDSSARPAENGDDQSRREQERMIREIEDIVVDFGTNCGGNPSNAVRRDINLAKQRVLSGSMAAEKLHDYALSKLGELVSRGKVLLTEAALRVGNYGRIMAAVRFPHVLHVDIGAPAATHRSLYDRCGKVLRSTLVKARREGKAALEQIPRDNSSVLRGFWVCGRGPSAREWLIKLATDVMATAGQNIAIRCVLFSDLPRGIQLIRGESENRFLNPTFWDRASQVIDRTFGLPHRTELQVITGNEFLENIRREIAQVQRRLTTSGMRYIISKVTTARKLRLNEVTGETADQIVFPMVKINGRAEEDPRPINSTPATRWHYDVGIIAVIPAEVRAVVSFLSPEQKLEPKRVASSGRIYYTKEMPELAPRPIRFVLTQALAQGNRSIVSAFDDMSTDYRPRWIVLLGIAGSIHKDAKLTDVVVAEQSVYYDRRAETSTGPSHRGESYLIDPTARSVINAILAEDHQFEAAPNSFAKNFDLHLAPIGTGEAVVKFRDAEVRQWLAAYNDKTLALETEAGGFGQAFYEMKLNPDRGPQGALILRGISDHADHEKNDKWQAPAAQNCCCILRRFVTSLASFNLLE